MTSCRKDVPGSCSAYCRLKEKVEELWRRAANAIKTVNNVQPDGNNNLTIEAGDGIQIEDISNGIKITNTGAIPDTDSIKTINYVVPDDEGDFVLRGGTGIDIEEIEDEEGINGLEISCNVEAPEYIGIDPITIDNHQISLNEWELYKNTDWTIFLNGYIAKEDLYIVHYDMINQEYLFASTCYIPANTDTRKIYLTGEYVTTNIDATSGNRWHIFRAQASNVLNNSTSVSVGYWTMRWGQLSAGNGGPRESFYISNTGYTSYAADKATANPVNNNRYIALYRRKRT